MSKKRGKPKSLVVAVVTGALSKTSATSRTPTAIMSARCRKAIKAHTWPAVAKITT